VPYSLLGVIRDDRFLLSFPVESGYSLLILGAGAGDRHQGTIRVDQDELQFNTFNLSADGILSALLVSNYEAKLVWWRTDKIWGALTP
jgi:hypothetical protein